jgi:hypothetical protein
MPNQSVTLNINTTGDESTAATNSSQTAINLDSLNDLADLLKRAGIKGRESQDNEIIDIGIEPEEISFDDEVEENADYDYGRNPTSRKGFVYNVDPYGYLGGAELDTRNVPARMADNPLRKVNGKTFEDYLYDVEQRKNDRHK